MGMWKGLQRLLQQIHFTNLIKKFNSKRISILAGTCSLLGIPFSIYSTLIPHKRLTEIIGFPTSCQPESGISKSDLCHWIKSPPPLQAAVGVMIINAAASVVSLAAISTVIILSRIRKEKKRKEKTAAAIRGEEV